MTPDRAALLAIALTTGTDFDQAVGAVDRVLAEQPHADGDELARLVHVAAHEASAVNFMPGI